MAAQESEYGGVPGLVTPAGLRGRAGASGNGVALGTPEGRRQVAEEAMLTRMLGMREHAGLGFDPLLGDEVRRPNTIEEMREHLLAGYAWNEDVPR